MSAISPLVARFRAARHDPAVTVLEGFHAVKHATRFNAEILDIVTSDPEEVERLTADLAADLQGRLLPLAERISPEQMKTLAPRAPRTGIIALARRPVVDVHHILAETGSPLILLEDPRNLGNMGACVRVAAAADIAGVLTTGTNDPWHPDAVRGAAGLHYAVPVARVGELPETDRPVIAVDPEGDDFIPDRMPASSLLVFGTERYGISDEYLARADSRVAIPMRPGVSSLNLATSVAAILFAWRMSHVTAA